MPFSLSPIWLTCADLLHQAAVRDTLEQIDVAKRLFERYDEVRQHLCFHLTIQCRADILKKFQYCTDSNCVSASHKRGRLASMLGAEGLHQAGSSIANIRMLYELGVRYCTLTHFCSNAFATSANDAEPGKHDPGLTKVGTAAVMEMNRLGMLVDISHVSFQTMADVLALSQSPVIFSHSGVLELSNHYRNVPDHIIRELPRNGGVLMVAFVSAFLRVNAPEDASLEDVVDHIFHIAKVAGWDHVGLGSDFDGFATMPVGMQDVACYPMLVAAVIRRGATDEQVQKLIGGNILRVMRENERIAARLQGRGELPREDVIPGRTFPINWKPGRDRLEAESVD